MHLRIPNSIKISELVESLFSMTAAFSIFIASQLFIDIAGLADDSMVAPFSLVSFGLFCFWEASALLVSGVRINLIRDGLRFTLGTIILSWVIADFVMWSAIPIDQRSAVFVLIGSCLVLYFLCFRGIVRCSAPQKLDT